MEIVYINVEYYCNYLARSCFWNPAPNRLQDAKYGLRVDCVDRLIENSLAIIIDRCGPLCRVDLAAPFAPFRSYERSTVVGARATARALNWADYLKSHAFRLYSVGSFMAENAARLLLDRRAQLPECFTARQVYRKDWAGLSDSDAAEAAIDVLIQHGYSQEQAVLPTIAGGRPTGIPVSKARAEP